MAEGKSSFVSDFNLELVILEKKPCFILLSTLVRAVNFDLRFQFGNIENPVFPFAFQQRARGHL